jgi:replicative DNA helicase
MKRNDMMHLEEVLIGTLISYREYRDLIFNTLDATYFHYLRPVYLEACKQHTEGTVFNEDTLAAKIEGMNIDEFYALMMMHVASEDETRAYLKTLKDTTDKNRLRYSINHINDIASSPNTTMDDLLVEIDKLNQTVDDASQKIALTPSEILERETNEPKKEKLLTGVHKLDEALYTDVGLHRGDINIILADSGHGKTQWATFVASKLAQQGYQGLWFQMEDYDVNTAKQLGLMAGYEADNVRIIDSVDDIDEIKRMCRLNKMDYGLDFVVIDYIQEVYAQGKFDSRTLEIQHVTRIMKEIAKQLNVLVIVPSQVTINGMNRSGWQLVPKYKDAQWAQAIKNVAHCMTSVFRPNMIQGLVTRDHEGFLAVKGLKDGETHDYQSVFAKLVKTRRGQLSHNYLHMVHNGDMGLEVVKSKI